MALARAPKLRQAACSRPVPVRRNTQHAVVLASFKAESGSWKPAAQETAGAALNWIKPEFDLDSFCLKKEVRKFSRAAARSLVVDGVVVEEEVPMVDRFSFKLPLYYKPDFATMRPFWHELL